jgi:hypothetical protein
MGRLQAWLDHKRERRADRRELRKERAARRRMSGGDTSRMGFDGVGRGDQTTRPPNPDIGNGG